MGWGWIPLSGSQSLADPHVDNPPDNFSAQHFWRWVRDATDWNIAQGNANPMANSRAVAARQRWSGGGLQPYYDLNKQSVATFKFFATLHHPGPDALTITTSSSAESFFARPDQTTHGKTELPTLFRPYWQSRLAPAEQPS